CPDELEDPGTEKFSSNVEWEKSCYARRRLLLVNTRHKKPVTVVTYFNAAGHCVDAALTKTPTHCLRTLDALTNGGIVMRKFAAVVIGGAMLAGIGAWVADAQTPRSEAAAHPRIAAAIRELEGAISYLEAAPHDFGGHKVAAIRDSRAAVVQLKLALAYRAKQDR